jgi:phenylacetic acid degradation protein
MFANRGAQMAKVYAIDGVVPVIDPAAFVHPDAVLIGDVIVGPGCYVGPGASLRGDMGRLVMGRGANLQDNCIVHGFPGTDTTIEEDGHIGHGAVLHGCVVKRNALVGMGAVIMDGAVIGEEAFVAALAFVKAGFQVPPRKLAAGMPAKIVRDLSAEEIAWKSAGTREYQQLARRCLATLVPATPLTAPEPNRRRLELSDLPPLYQMKQSKAE